MFMVEECIENRDKALTITKCTNTVLSKSGNDFFIAHVEDNERYQKLVDKYYEDINLFIQGTILKVRKLGKNDIADTLDQNKDKLFQYLYQNKWT